MVNAYVLFSAIVAVIAIALGGAYVSGALNVVIEMIAVYFLKAEGKAEEKKLEVQGLKEGEDFLKDDLKGNKQANDVVNKGLGAIGGLPKGL